MKYSAAHIAEYLGQNPPTLQQQEVIESPLEPALVVAGAGSGKTATMASRVVWLIANSLVKPEEILGVTFTKKAAGELSSRINHSIDTLYRSGMIERAEDHVQLPAQVSTYHSYANSLVAEHGLRVGLEPGAQVLSRAQSYQMVQKIVEDYNGPWEHLNLAKSTLINAVLSFSSEAGDHLQSLERAKDHVDELVARLSTLPHTVGANKKITKDQKLIINNLMIRSTVAELAELFQQAKNEAGVMDFGDLINYAVHLTELHPLVRERETSKYKVVLLDEFQDTSFAQMKLFANLYGTEYAVMAVGDPNQSIYGFRGASAGQLFSFTQHFSSGAGSAQATRQYSLSTAWRNSVAVLDAANAMSEPLRINPRFMIPELQPRQNAPAGEVQAQFYPTRAEEINALVQRVAQLRQEDPHDSNAVLFRTRSSMTACIQALEHAGIPVEVVGLAGLLRQPEIIEIMSTLHVLVEPERPDSLIRLLSSARWRIGSTDLMALARLSREEQKAQGGTQASTLSLIDALEHLPQPGTRQGQQLNISEEGLRRMHALKSEIRYLRSIVNHGLVELIHEIVRTSGLDIELLAHPRKKESQAYSHLDEFLSHVSAFVAGNGNPDIYSLLQWLEDSIEHEDGLGIPQQDLDPSAVQLMTIHASKGLEWDNVFIPSMVQGNFPHDRVSRWSSATGSLPWPLRADAAELPEWDLDVSDLKSLQQSEDQLKEDAQEYSLEEERRLAYVAITRARNLVVCSGAMWVPGNKKPKNPSIFLKQLKAHLHNEESWEFPEQTEHESETPNSISVSWPYDPLEGPRLSVSGERMHPWASRREPLDQASHAVLQAQDVLAQIAPEKRVEFLESALDEPGKALLHEAQELVALRENYKLRSRGTPPNTLSSTTLMQLFANQEDVLAQWQRPMPKQPIRSSAAGTEFHTRIERHYGDSGLELSEFIPAADASFDDAGIDTLMQAFLECEFAERTPAYVEFPFETQIGSKRVAGRIDAIFANEDGSWTIVDWKSGKAPSSEEELRKRAVQLSIYQIAWSRLKNIDPQDISLAFFFAASAKTEYVQGVLDEREIERNLARSLQDFEA